MPSYAPTANRFLPNCCGADHDDLQPELWLTSYLESQFDTKLAFADRAHVYGAFIHQGQLILAGRQSEPHNLWFSAITTQGQEAWRREAWLCGEGIDCELTVIVEHQGTLWALAQVLSFDGKWTTLLVNIDFDGSISSVRTIVIDDHVGEYAEVNVLARSDAGTYVGGIITQLEGNRRYIARLAL